jgi:uncharacterized protein YndB with AHSA1/START domain
MNHSLTVSKSITINAGVAKVWHALTTPALIAEYLFGTETVTDWKVGGPIIFQGEYQGQKYRDKGVILEYVLHERIRYSYWSGFSGLDDKPENYSVVSYSLRKLDDTNTELTWTQQGFANEGAHKHSESGMDAFLASVKTVMER